MAVDENTGNEPGGCHDYGRLYAEYRDEGLNVLPASLVLLHF